MISAQRCIGCVAAKLAQGAILLALVVGCQGEAKQPSKPALAVQAKAQSKPEKAPANASVHAPTTDADAKEQAAHHVVLADRTSHGYLLLLEKNPDLKDLSRGKFAKLVKKKLDAKKIPQANFAELLVTRDPEKQQVEFLRGTQEERKQILSQHGADLLGFHFEVLPMMQKGALIAPELLRDPILTRALSILEKESIGKRSYILLLRADYRNMHSMRGYRMLQAITEVLATDYNALIFDPDTNETVGPKAFAQRRYLGEKENVADQITVIPFSDSRNGDAYLRLMTRGMRRFGSPDLELDGLPKDPNVLQRATHLLNALAYLMAKQAQLDEAGYAIEADEQIKVAYAQAVLTYSNRDEKLPRCQNCPGHTQVHLVERQSEEQDPHGHVVARVIAPRVQSDKAQYDHPAWVKRAVAASFGTN